MYFGRKIKTIALHWAARVWVPIIVIIGTLLASAVYGHGGGLDRCGGHHDRKHGGYHLHNMVLYCACLPEGRGCGQFTKKQLADEKSNSASADAELLPGRVVRITDGDTITLLDATDTQHKIRLGGIDAPEKGQPFGNVSRQHLAELAFGKPAEADCYKIDRYKRLICTVYVDGKDMGLAQLDAGLAWWYRKYANEQPPQERLEYEMAENKAAVDRVGLWSDPNPIPPWAWRKAEREP